MVTNRVSGRIVACVWGGVPVNYDSAYGKF